MMNKIYEVENLQAAREYISGLSEKVTLINPQGSTRYYGMKVIDYIFKILLAEFPSKIEGVIIDAYDDYSALVTAKELGYKVIRYINTDDQEELAKVG